MRRFSQRNALVTLSEINITPLLDLAFVLLIIFVITTPLLEKGLDLKLPSGTGKPDRPLQRNDIRTVEITPRGDYFLEHRQMRLDQIEAELVKDFRANPNLVVYIRADGSSSWNNVNAVFDRCQRNGITRVSPRQATGKP
jgi:biopolymer transport protein ExbD